MEIRWSKDVGAIQDKTFVVHLNEMSSGGQLVLKSVSLWCGHMNLSLRTCSAPKQIPNVTPPPYVDLTLLPISLKTLGLWRGHYSKARLALTHVKVLYWIITQQPHSTQWELTGLAQTNRVFKHSSTESNSELTIGNKQLQTA